MTTHLITDTKSLSVTTAPGGIPPWHPLFTALGALLILFHLGDYAWAKYQKLQHLRHAVIEFNDMLVVLTGLLAFAVVIFLDAGHLAHMARNIRDEVRAIIRDWRS